MIARDSTHSLHQKLSGMTTRQLTTKAI